MNHLRVTMTAIFFFFLVKLLCISNLAAAATCHPDDHAGLLAFKAAIKHDPAKLLADWKSGTDCCTWHGITCQDNKRVSSLWLSTDKPTTYLTGHISPAISKLRYLDGLYLMDLKNISGRIPDSIFTMPSLQFVYLENNKLSGLIPAGFSNLTKLYALSLTGNQFIGRIPSSLGSLAQLSQLKLGKNQLTGAIPTSFKNLKSLTYLNLENNKLVGRLPNWFDSLTNLYFLELSGNAFTGTIPASIAALAPRLQFLTLGRNQFSGPIPSFLSRFTKLDTLDLSSNRFTGPVPKSFANLTKIFNLDLSRNQLTDPFPALFVKGIESIDLSYNKFHLGTIPKWIQTSPIIYSLKLAGCGLKMKMEDFKPEETYYYDYIDLSDNEITGSPVQILNQTEYLVGFSGSGNKLRFDLGKTRFPKTLTEFDLARNLVFGTVPKEVAQLKKLNVSYNHLCGKLPTTSFGASAFVGNDCLCGSPLGACK